MNNLTCPGSKLLREPKPEIFPCPRCNSEIEVWTDEIKGTCSRCGYQIMRDLNMACLEWCKCGEECVGPETYNKYKRNKSNKSEL
jgi:hypothetical protein